MAATGHERFTGGVFQDVVSTEKGIEALRRQGFLVEDLSLISLDTPEARALAERVFGSPPAVAEVRGLGPAISAGPFVKALDGPDNDFARFGLAAAIGRVGFLPHDGQIFEKLTARGGVLIAVRGEERAADALATLHSYGAGNAAIGAWTGRV